MCADFQMNFFSHLVRRRLHLIKGIFHSAHPLIMATEVKSSVEIRSNYPEFSHFPSAALDILDFFGAVMYLAKQHVECIWCEGY